MAQARIRIATRGSELALWQARHVAAAIGNLDTDLSCELIEFTTTGDRILDRPLAKVGGKGLFTKELERALLDDEADIAVHSMKDVPQQQPGGLLLPVMITRAEPRDMLVCDQAGAIDELAKGAVVGTSSLRRQSQLLHRRPDLRVVSLRGNVPTRLEKLGGDDLDAVVLAAAGLERLDLIDQRMSVISETLMLPAVGQGAIGLQMREGDALIGELEPLNHEPTLRCVQAERALANALGASCEMPLGGFATCENGKLRLRAVLADPSGGRLVKVEQMAALEEGLELGKRVAEQLRAQGGDSILAGLL
ncbi:MAG: hydroxymethylbilane synthase [Pseudomonadota bacterium]